jgi:hypothetical protein
MKPALPEFGGEIAHHEAETILQAWGAFKRAEVEDEVGYPGFSPSCADYSSPPEHNPPPPPPIRRGDIDRACWAMVILSARHPRQYRDMRDHYRDGAKLDPATAAAGRHKFAGIWREWDSASEPVNSM